MINILFLFLFYFQTIYTIPEHAHYFLDAKRIYNIEQTQQELFKLGFKKIYFTTQDNIKICGLFLDKSSSEKIQGTIIYIAGFYHGLKEGMASFYSLVIDQPYNVLLFDARGHNESEGDFLSYQGIKNYGQSEALDIIAAIKYIHSYNVTKKINPNIIIHGICSGAFNSIKALTQLSENACPECKAIQGIIFDSGWFRFEDVAKTTIYAETEKRFKKSWFWWATKPISFIIYQIYNLLFAQTHKAQPDIYESIQKINWPIFFVHCDNDPYVSIDPVKKFIKECNCKYYWWIPHNSHANYHMHNYQDYKNKLLEFFEAIT
ncbi:hypothetical protein HYV10_00945 [Candidatus Dependentiae bacterium]|nr:hypothetical protein [Candidatus Dependentiae bacterium]